MDSPRLPPPSLRVAVCQFNAGRYFSCHETLEELWIAEPGRVRRFYQGILQIAAALHHLQQGNERGAVLLLGKGGELLRPFAPACLGIDVASLRAGAQQLLTAIETHGMAQALALTDGLLPRIRQVPLDGA